MLPANWNFTIYPTTLTEANGDNICLHKLLKLYNENMIALNLTGAEVVFDAKVNRNDALPVIHSYEVGDGDDAIEPNMTVTIDEVNGTIVLEMTVEQVAALDFDIAEFVLDVDLTGASDRLFQGQIVLDRRF